MKDIIKKALEEKGMTQKELAELIHQTPQAVSKWVNGESTPKFDNIQLMTDIFGLEFGEAMLKKGIQDKRIMEKQPSELKDLDSYEKAEAEAKKILRNSGAENYSHAVYTLLSWALICSIGLAYHWFIHKKNKEEGTVYEDIYFYLNNLIEERGKDMEHDFFLLGGDLFESWGEYKICNHDYAYAVNDLWFKFKEALKFADDSELYREFKVALLYVIFNNSCY